jgi:hypothetical protein
MINRQALMDLVARAERGALLPGEAAILRDAVALLDDLAATLDKIIGSAAFDHAPAEVSRDLARYDLESTAQLKIIEQGDLP